MANKPFAYDVIRAGTSGRSLKKESNEKKAGNINMSLNREVSSQGTQTQ